MRTRDAKFIDAVMNHPDVYPWITDDGCPDAMSIHDYVSNDKIYFISPNEYTVFALFPVNSVTWEIHTCILKPGRGKTAIESAQKMIEYMFTQTPCKKLISWVPEPYKHVLKYALMNGLKIEGCSKKSFLKYGKLQDLTLVGITKGDWSCH
jgi:hypothetical protein